MSKLSGNYTHEEISRVLQGNFACREFTRNSKKEPLEDPYIRLELFFVAVEIHPVTGKLVISKITDDDKGGTKLTPLLEFTESQVQQNSQQD